MIILNVNDVGHQIVLYNDSSYPIEKAILHILNNRTNKRRKRVMNIKKNGNIASIQLDFLNKIPNRYTVQCEIKSKKCEIKYFTEIKKVEVKNPII